jgi:hypothetical protein
MANAPSRAQATGVAAEASRSDDAAQAPSAEQAIDPSDSDRHSERSALAVESDDDDCDEASPAPLHLSLHIARPAPSFAAPLASDIGPAQGHGAGPEKPPRA